MTMIGFQSGSGSWLTCSIILRFFFDVLTNCGDTMNFRNSPKSHTSPIWDWHWLWTVRWHQQHFKSTIPGPSPQTSSQTSHSECNGRFPGIQWCRNFWSLSSTETALQMWVVLAFLMQVAWTQHPMPQLEQNWPKRLVGTPSKNLNFFLSYLCLSIKMCGKYYNVMVNVIPYPCIPNDEYLRSLENQS